MFRRVIYFYMDDALHCPICQRKLRTRNLDNKLLLPVGKTANYVERVCSKGYNHCLVIWTDKANNQVDLLKVSITSTKYIRLVELDYINQKSRIACPRDGKYEYINIPKLMEADFPDLVKLKERVSLYVLFS